MSVTVYGSVKKVGFEVKLQITGRLGFQGQLADTILRGRDEANVIFIVKEDLEPKTNPQLRYYFGVVVPYARLGYLGVGWEYDKEQTDIELRKQGFTRNIHNVKTGETITVPDSLGKASKKRVSEYIDWCCRFILEELGVVVPPPDEKYIEFVNKPEKAV